MSFLVIAIANVIHTPPAAYTKGACCSLHFFLRPRASELSDDQFRLEALHPPAFVCGRTSMEQQLIHHENLTSVDCQQLIIVYRNPDLAFYCIGKKSIAGNKGFTAQAR